MPTTPPTIPLITEPLPLSTDPENFDPRADQAWEDLQVTIAAMNASAAATMANAQAVLDAANDILAAALVATDAAGLVGRMSGSLALGAGTKAVTLVAAKLDLAVATKQVVLVLESDASIRMFGNIAASPTPTSTSFSVTVTSGGVFPSGGSGSFSGWKIIDAAFFASAATVAEIRLGATDIPAIGPKSLRDSKGSVALAYASTVTPNIGVDGEHRRMTASASFTVGAPTGAKEGDCLIIDGLNSAGSIVLAVNAVWKRSTLGVLPPGNGARWKFYGFIDEVDGSGNVTRGSYNVQTLST